MQGDWRVFVNPRPGDWNVDIWLTHRQGERNCSASVKNGYIEMQELKEGTAPPKPLLRIPQDVWQLIVDAATETSPPTKKERVEAELEATNCHLADMRRQVFDSPHLEHKEPEDDTFSKN